MSLIETMNLSYSSAQLLHVRIALVPNYYVFEYYSSAQLPYMRALCLYRSFVSERALIPLYPYELRMSS